MKIYVGGGSTELDRVSGFIDDLEILGHEITHDWVKTIREVGDANPREATAVQQREWVAKNKGGIKEADLCVFLLPELPSYGVAFDLKIAERFHVPVILVQSPQAAHSIYFSELPDDPVDSEQLFLDALNEGVFDSIA